MRVIVKCACGHSWQAPDGQRFEQIECPQCGNNPTAKMNQWIERYEIDKARQEIKNATSNTR